MNSSGWVVVVFEEAKDLDDCVCVETAFVKGPFALYEEAVDWSENSPDCPGACQITFLEPAVVK
jgi:hypothetical protein